MGKRSYINTCTNLGAINHTIRFDMTGVTNLGILDDTARFDINVITQSTVAFEHHTDIDEYVLTGC